MKILISATLRKYQAFDLDLNLSRLQKRRAHRVKPLNEEFSKINKTSTSVTTSADFKDAVFEASDASNDKFSNIKKALTSTSTSASASASTALRDVQMAALNAIVELPG